jgi:hypothetical protein
MKSKVLWWIVAVIGLVLLVGGLVLMFAVVPGMKKMPADTDVTRTYQGTMPVALNPQTMAFSKDLPIEITRHFAVTTTDGDLALVKEERTMTSGGQPLQQVVSNYSIDRTTMAWGDGYPASWAENEGFWPREGIVLSWPIGTEQKDYTGWSDDYRATVPLKFDGEVTHDRSGMKTYLFTSQSGPKPIAAEEVATLGLPTELSKDQLLSLVGQANLSPLVAQMLPALLKSIPGDTIPLQYTYAYEGKYWIDPTTGIMIDTEKHEVRKAGISDEILAQTPLANLPEEQKDGARVTVSDYTYKTTDASVQDAKKDAQDKGGAIKLYGTTLPLIGIVIGALLLAAGIVMAIRAPKTAAAAA